MDSGKQEQRVAGSQVDESQPDLDVSPGFMHDIIFRLVEEVCGDKDYLYRSFTGHFCALMDQIYGSGGTAALGSYVVNGIKSGLEARLDWSLDHQLNYHGPNQLRIDYEVGNVTSGVVTSKGSIAVELGTGRRL